MCDYFNFGAECLADCSTAVPSAVVSPQQEPVEGTSTQTQEQVATPTSEPVI